MKRFAALAVTMVLVLAACGGDGDSSTTDATETVEAVDPSEVFDSETLAAIDRAMDDLGNDGAFKAVLFAWDDGYDANQITAAMANGSLDSDGSITGMTPSGPAFDLIDRSRPSAHGDVIVLAAGEDLALGPPKVNPELLKSDILDQGARLFRTVDPEAERRRNEMSDAAGRATIGLLLKLSKAGYSVEQFVEAFILDLEIEWVPFLDPSAICMAIKDGRRFVAPTAIPTSQGPDDTCSNWYQRLREDETPNPTTATETTTQDTSASGDFSFVASLEGDGLEWEWTGAFSIVGDQLVGSGTVAGTADTTCSVGDGPEYPVAFTGSGSYDITGTADGTSMQIVLDPTAGTLDITAGDTTQLCVDVSLDVGEVLAQFPMGDLELTEVPLELPIEGGQTSLDFGGFVFDVTVSAN